MADGSIKIAVGFDDAELKRLLGGLDSTIKRWSGMAVKSLAAVSAGIMAIGAPVVKLGADYEASMSGIKAVSGATEAEMVKLGAAAKKAGADTVYSASESANAIEELLKAGLTTEQVLGGGLTGALDLAAAGEIGVADAAEVASTALNAFRDDALTVGDAANILAGAANASATDVMGMKMGLSQVSSVASGMGMTFKDTATGLALFAQNGLKGSDAGTSLKTMLMNLQPLTEKQAVTFKRLGLMTEQGTSKFYDAKGSLRSMEEIAGILQTSLHGLSDAERAMALETIFGSDAVRAGNVLFKEGAEGVKKMAAAMDKVKAADVAAQRLDNLKGDVEALTGTMETLGIGIYEGFQKPLRNVVQYADGAFDKLLKSFETGGMQGLVSEAGKLFAELVEKAASFAPQVVNMAVSLLKSFVQGLIDNKAAVVAAVSSLIEVFVTALVELIPIIIEAGLMLVGALFSAIGEQLASSESLFEGFIKGVLVAAGALYALGIAVKAFNAIVKLLNANPVMLAITAVTALTGLMAGLASAFNKPSAAMKKHKEEMKEIAEATERAREETQRSIEQGDDMVATAKAEAEGTTALKNELIELVEAQKTHGGYQDLIAEKVKALNGEIEGLNLSYDETTNTLSKSSEELANYTKHLELAAEIEATLAAQKGWRTELQKLDADQAERQARINDLLVEGTKGQEMYATALELKTKYGKNWIFTAETQAMGMAELTEAEGLALIQAVELGQASKENAEQQASLRFKLDHTTGSLKILTEEQGKYAAATEDSTAAMSAAEKEQAEIAQRRADEEAKLTDAMRDAANERGMLLEDYTKALEESEKAADDYVDGVINAFKRLTTEEAISAENAADNLKKNLADKQNWAENLRKLAERGLDPELIQELSEQGVEKMGQSVALWVKATDEELDNLNGVYREAGEAAAREAAGGAERYAYLVAKAAKGLGELSVDEIKELYGTFHYTGGSVSEAVAKGLRDNTPRASAAASSLAKRIEQEMTAGERDFYTIGKYVAQGLALGIEDHTGLASSAAAAMMRKTIGSAKAVSQERSPSRVMKESGKNFVLGLMLGISDNAKVAATASKHMMIDTIGAAKAVAQIRSPSKVMRDIVGKNIALGVAVGIKENESEAVKAARELADSVLDAAESWIDDEKYFDRLSLSGELEAYKALQKAFVAGSEQRKQIDREVYRVEKEMREANLEAQEAAAERAAEAAQKVIDAKRAQFEHSMRWIETEKYYGRLSLEEEIAAYNRVLKRYAAGTEEYIEMQREIYRVKQGITQRDFEAAKKAIDDKKRYEQMSLADEYRAWATLQKQYAAGTEQRIEAEERLRDLKLEIAAEVDAIQQRYADAHQARAQQIFNSYGLFDEVELPKYTSEDRLIANAEDQVAMLTIWSDNIAALAERGIEGGMLDSLREMGPAANDEIAALLRMTDEQLTHYADLYAEKQRLANKQATEELKDLRAETLKEIAALDVTKSANSIGKSLADGIADGFDAGKQSILDRIKGTIDALVDKIGASFAATFPGDIMDGVVAKIPKSILADIRKDQAATVSPAAYYERQQEKLGAELARQRVLDVFDADKASIALKANVVNITTPKVEVHVPAPEVTNNLTFGRTLDERTFFERLGVGLQRYGYLDGKA